MCLFDKLFVVVLNFLWILLLYGSEANTYDHFNDVLNPISEKLDVWHQRSPRVAIRNNEKLKCERPNIYICEVPPNVIPPDFTKTCDYRNWRYHEQVYRWMAGWGCLFYTPDFLFTAGYDSINLTMSCFYGNLLAPCLEITKEDGTCGCFPFDPGFEEVTTAVRQAMIPSAHGRWERCFYAASHCCSNYMAEDVNSTWGGQCDTTFDGWTCWHRTDAGSVANEVCSEFAYSNVGPSCHHFSSKQCFNNATWEVETDYSTCSITPRLLRRYRFHIAMLSFSIVSCLPAVCIFFFYKRLRITRVALHRNLLIVIILRNILVIISRSEIYIDEITNAGDTALSTHSIACRILSVAERVAANAVFVCMLIEGIYLHRLIAAVFKKQLNVKWLYIIGIVIAIAPVAAWSAVMGVYNDHSCWLIYTVDNIQWILDAPRIAILLVNTILFVDVLRILLTKIRNAENANQLNTAKTTLFLMPIFGTQFLLTAFRPNTTNCMSEQVYYYIAYTVEGLQGFIVAMLYCYVNKEVRMLLKATYVKTESAVVSRYRRGSNYPRMSIDPKLSRRFTYSTAVPSQNDDPKDHAAVTPKLHVAEIISIQASKRLSDILEPVYETIEDGVINEGYDSLAWSSVDNDSGSIDKRDSKVLSRRFTYSTAVPSQNDDPKDYAAVTPKLHVAEITSIQASERLSDILEPVYETIEDGVINEGYDSLARSSVDNDSGYIAKRDSKVDNNYYNFTNSSSVLIDCQDWIKCISSPTSSVCNNSLNDYETKYLERKFPNHPNWKEYVDSKKHLSVQNSTKESDISLERKTNNTGNNDSIVYEKNQAQDSDNDNMLYEIMQYMATNDNNSIQLNPNVLSPNRKDEDKIYYF